MANLITGVRFLCAAALLFCPPFSPAFYALYFAAGLSDMLDGAAARRTNTVSAFGAKLDTVADFAFAAACLVRLLPVLDVSRRLRVWIAVIAVIKGVNVVSGYVVRKEFVTVHTTANRITGLLLFLLPLSVPFIPLRYSAPAVCAAATFAAIREGHLIRTGQPAQKPDR